jgi:hypothetical protein
MTPRARAWLRAGLFLLAAVDGLQGVWMTFFPRSFYVDIPTVSMYPPFNEHLMTDLGGTNLAMTVVLCVSAIAMERRLVRTALAAYLVYAVEHLAYHATHRMGMPTADAIFLTTGLALLTVIPVALLALTRRPATTSTRRS